ncbi:hypothetical protein [Brevundimonas sp.]|uniref:hypothetical protein n=1 Tax=Brevundimonas sp. TaxID=1871086 RepID=UPI002FC968D6
MKRIIASLAAIAMMAGAAPAFAGISPTSTTVTLSGKLNVNQYLSGQCDTSFTLDVNSAGTGGSITGSNFGAGSPCSSISQSGTWQVDYVGPGVAVIRNLYVTTSAGWCQGDITVNVNNATGQVTIPSQTINGQIFGFLAANCTLDSDAASGHFTSSPALSVT